MEHDETAVKDKGIIHPSVDMGYWRLEEAQAAAAKSKVCTALRMLDGKEKNTDGVPAVEVQMKPKVILIAKAAFKTGELRLLPMSGNLMVDKATDKIEKFRVRTDTMTDEDTPRPVYIAEQKVIAPGSQHKPVVEPFWAVRRLTEALNPFSLLIRISYGMRNRPHGKRLTGRRPAYKSY